MEGLPDRRHTRPRPPQADLRAHPPRLSGLAAAGELLVSAAAAAAAGLDSAGLEHRCLELRGREETLDAYVAAAAA